MRAFLKVSTRSLLAIPLVLVANALGAESPNKNIPATRLRVVLPASLVASATSAQFPGNGGGQGNLGGGNQGFGGGQMNLGGGNQGFGGQGNLGGGNQGFGMGNRQSSNRAQGTLAAPIGMMNVSRLIGNHTGSRNSWQIHSFTAGPRGGNPGGQNPGAGIGGRGFRSRSPGH
jgi:hypothetical protein